VFVFVGEGVMVLVEVRVAVELGITGAVVASGSGEQAPEQTMTSRTTACRLSNPLNFFILPP
jgi:hypothetical protein